MNQEQQQGQFEPASVYDLPIYGWLRKFTVLIIFIFGCAFLVMDDGRGWAFLGAVFSSVVYFVFYGLDTQRRVILTQQQQIDQLFRLLEEKNHVAVPVQPIFGHADTEYQAETAVTSTPFDASTTSMTSPQLNVEKQKKDIEVVDVDPYTTALGSAEKAQTTDTAPTSTDVVPTEATSEHQLSDKQKPSWMQTEQPSISSTSAPIFAHSSEDEKPTDHDVYSMTSLWRAFMTWFKGGNSIVRIAIIILLIGVILLLRFASEYWQPTLSTKMAGIAVAGGVLTAIGYRLRHKRYGYAISVQGAGLGVLFLVLFSAFRLEVMTSVSMSYALLIGLLATTLFLALRQNALILAFIALGSGFIAPFILNTGSNNIPALFSYYLALNIALAVIAFFKPWRILNTVSLLSTFGIGGLSIWLKATPEQYGMLTVLVWLHFALYLFISIRYSLQAAQYKTAFKDMPIIDTTLIFATPFMAFTLYAGLVYHNSHSLSVASAILAGVYFATGFVLHKKYQSLTLLIQCFYGLGLTFFALILPFAFDAQWTSTGWAVQALALIWLGCRHRLNNSVCFGLVLLACSTVSWCKSLWMDESIALIAVFFLAFALIGSLYVFMTPEQNQPDEHAESATNPPVLFQNTLTNMGRVFSFFGLQAVLVTYVAMTDHLHQLTQSAMLMLGVSVMCVAISFRIYQLYRTATLSLQLFLACTLVYFAFIPVFLWDSDIISLWWSVQGLLTIFAASHYALPYIRQLGTGMLVANAGITFFSILEHKSFTLSAVTIFMLALVIGAYTLLYHQKRMQALDRIGAYILVVLSFLFSIYMGDKLYDALDWRFYSTTFGVLVWWLILTVIYRILQKTLDKAWLWLTLVVMAVGALDLTYIIMDYSLLTAPWLFDFDLKATLFMLAVLWWVAFVFVLKVYAKQLQKPFTQMLMVVAVGMLAVIGGVFSASELSFVPCLMLLPVVVLLASLKVPILRFLAPYWIQNYAFLIVALMSLWAVSIDHDGTWNLGYLPVLNPIDLLSVGVFMMIVLNMQNILRSSQQGQETERHHQIFAAVILVITGLLLLSSLMLRSLHHYMSLPYWSLQAWQNGTVQASLTILWAALALILTTFASKKALRYVWLLGIAVLAVVIAKLIFLDLSHTHTITRIISFIGSGLIMLVIGYFAPLPPTKNKPPEFSS